MLCKRDGCGHEDWDHFEDEDYDNVYFGQCKVDGCECENLLREEE